MARGLKSRRSTSAPTAREQRFMDALAELGCICCKLQGIDYKVETERDHMNEGGLAGGKRMGHMHILAQCQWHHRSMPFDGMNERECYARFGPSQFLHKREHLLTYGSFAEQFVIQQQMLEHAGLWRDEWNP